MNAKVVTFGCRLNTYESSVMEEHAQKAGLEDTIIFNTCAVTKEAERTGRQAIRRARRENPNAKIVVTGCAAQISPDSYADMPEVDQIIGNDLKLKEQTWTSKPEEKIIINDIMAVEETASHLVNGFDGRARAFLQVQNGCDHRCTFCIIPYGRGNSRSVPIGEVVKATRNLVEQGYNEIVMTGVDVTSYGPDLPGKPTLGQMLRRVLALVPELPRLRLSSLDPVEIDEDMWWLIEHEPRFMPHLHLSLQAGDDMVLKRMKRRHLRQDAIDVCKKARELRPNIGFGADIIAGFPTETDEMFENSLKIIEECDLTYLHVFPYSEREGTPASKIPANKQVDVPVRKERAKRLRQAGEKQLHAFLEKQIGQECNIVVERNNLGHTENFAEVSFEEDLEIGSLAKVKITGIKEGKLIAMVI